MLTELFSFLGIGDSKTVPTSLYINLTKIVEERGCIIVDVPSDGNCFFHAVIDQLQQFGSVNTMSTCNAWQLRQDAVTYLEKNPKCIEESFLIRADYKNFTVYLKSQRLNGHWCDEPIVRATADILGADIHIWHDNGHITIIKCNVCSLLDIKKVIIGLITETHYVSIHPKSFQISCVTNIQTSATIKDSLFTEKEHARNEIVNTSNADNNFNETINKENTQVEFFPEGLSLERFKIWQKNRPWLEATADGKVICTYCVSVKDLGLHSKERVRIERAFVEGLSLLEINSKKNKIKKLNDKITEHGKSTSHGICANIKLIEEKRLIEESLLKSENLWQIQHQNQITVTSRIFRTAYTVCKRDSAFTSHPEIMLLQELNGLDVGKCLFSDHSCKNIIVFVAEKMKEKLLKYILFETEETFSLLFDESTSVSVKTCLILYIRIMYNNEINNWFLDLLELSSQTGNDIADSLLEVLHKFGFTDDILKRRLIGICTDGASNLQGEIKGALALLKQKIDTEFIIFHCMAHKLELAIHDVLKTSTELSHFQMFAESLYSHFSRSPKNRNQLEIVAKEVHTELLKIGRIFDIRWVASSLRSVQAIWQNYPALVKHFETLSLDMCKNARDRSKCNGISQKLKKWLFVYELTIIKEALEVVKSLSLFLQRKSSSLRTANAEISNTIKTLSALKEYDGVSSQDFLKEFSCTGTFKTIKLMSPTDSEQLKFQNFKKRFFQSLVDNIFSRFDNSTLAMKHAEVLCKANWPKNSEELVLYGDREIMELRKFLKIEACHTSAIVHQFRMIKDGHDAEQELNDLYKRLDVLPISSAECERGFSAMNLTHTPLRNSLNVETINHLLFIKINGPPLQHFDAELYATLWLKDGRHSGSDVPSGKPTREVVMESRYNLFK